MKSNIFYSYFTLLFFIGVSLSPCLVAGREGRILNQNNGWDRSPITQIVQNFSSYIPSEQVKTEENFEIPATAQNQLSPYLVPPPSTGQYEIQLDTANLNNHKFAASEIDPVYHKTLSRPVVVLTDNKFANEHSNGSLNVQSNGYKINTISTATSQMMTGRRKRPSPLMKLKKVNMEKFKECIFFRVCEKSRCFHYGRFGICHGRPNSV